MSARHRPETDEVIYAVRQWKETLDTSAKWWQRLFYKLAYRPFNEFSLRVVKIPPANTITVEGDRVIFTIVEDGGYFGSEHEADLACITERDSYQAMTYGRAYPRESAQCIGPTIFPRAKNPLKRAAPILEMVITSRKVDQRIKQELTRLNETLDR